MYMLQSSDDEYTSIEELIDHVLNNGIDPSETVYQQDDFGVWKPVGEVFDFMME